jgi:hypothetical protein
MVSVITQDDTRLVREIAELGEHRVYSQFLNLWTKKISRANIARMLKVGKSVIRFCIIRKLWVEDGKTMQHIADVLNESETNISNIISRQGITKRKLAERKQIRGMITVDAAKVPAPTTAQLILDLIKTRQPSPSLTVTRNNTITPVVVKKKPLPTPKIADPSKTMLPAEIKPLTTKESKWNRDVTQWRRAIQATENHETFVAFKEMWTATSSPKRIATKLNVPLSVILFCAAKLMREAGATYGEIGHRLNMTYNQAFSLTYPYGVQMGEAVSVTTNVSKKVQFIRRRALTLPKPIHHGLTLDRQGFVKAINGRPIF